MRPAETRVPEAPAFAVRASTEPLIGISGERPDVAPARDHGRFNGAADRGSAEMGLGRDLVVGGRRRPERLQPGSRRSFCERRGIGVDEIKRAS